TVGDIESLPYIESVRQLKWEMGDTNSLVIHLTLVPFLAASGELKTKPTQHSVKVLLENGIQPNILVLRTEHELGDELRKKVALFCNVDYSAVIQSIDVSTIYEVPILMQKEKLDVTVLKKLGMSYEVQPDLSPWKKFLKRLQHPKCEVKIGLIGKYVELPDAYISITESFKHAGAVNNCHVNLILIHSEDIDESNYQNILRDLNGILVAPGFGDRGIEGKILAAKYARENNTPFLGICLGLQCAVIEFARHKLGLKKAHSTEMEMKTPHPVIDLMEDQKAVTEKGGTMRLGSYSCLLKESTKAYKAYGVKEITERHRHRYEFNDRYQKSFEKAGMIASGINPDNGLVEIMEISSHKWYVGVQFHPEYRSNVLNPHPLFIDFIKASIS
ncbi:MAG: CTP synthase, partial [Bacteroidales bacterium]|nr:CTP synthase [Bacteroidales bacterium]